MARPDPPRCLPACRYRRGCATEWPGNGCPGRSDRLPRAEPVCTRRHGRLPAATGPSVSRAPSSGGPPGHEPPDLHLGKDRAFPHIPFRRVQRGTHRFRRVPWIRCIGFRALEGFQLSTQQAFVRAGLDESDQAVLQMMEFHGGHKLIVRSRNCRRQPVASIGLAGEKPAPSALGWARCGQSPLRPSPPPRPPGWPAAAGRPCCPAPARPRARGAASCP